MWWSLRRDPGFHKDHLNLRWVYLSQRALAEFLLALVVGGVIAVSVVVGTYYLDKWKLVVGIVGGPAFILMTFRWPEYGILALLAITNGVINTNWLPLLGLGPFSFHIQDLMLGVLLLILVLRAATWPGYRLMNSPLSIPLLLFLFSIVLSVINGIYLHDLNVNVVLRRGRCLILWAAFFPVFQLTRTRVAVNRLILGFWALAVLLALGVVIRQAVPSLHPLIFPVDIETLHTLGTEVSGVGRVFQYRGGELLYAMIPVVIATLAFADEDWLTPGKHVLILILLGLELNWLVRSFQRSLWLTTGLSMVIFYLVIPRQDRARLVRRLVRFSGALVFVLALYSYTSPAETNRLASAVMNRAQSLSTDVARTDISVQWRLVENRYAFQTIRENPVVGIGVGNEYRPPFEQEIWANEFGLRWFLHDSYLWMTVMMGFVGLLSFLVLCILYVYHGLRFWSQIEDGIWRAVVFGFVLSFIGQMINNVTEPSFLDGPSQSVFPIMMALSESILLVARRESRAQ